MNKNLRRLAKLAIAMLAVALALLAKDHWNELIVYAKASMPIRHVRIEGRFRYLSREEVKQALLPVVQTDFFSADVHAIDRAAVAIPWAAAISVKRIWPDTIDIRIVEQKPAVRWGDYSLLNERGDPFAPVIPEELKSLPLVKGPEGYERRLLGLMRGLQKSLQRQHLELSEFYVTDRRSWKLFLANGLEIELGRQKPVKNFQRLLKILPVLGEQRIAGIAKIDMRYPNGFAVSWKPGAVVTWPEPKQVMKIDAE